MDLKAGTYTLKAEKKGYNSRTRYIVLARGEEVPIRLKLFSICGSLRILTEPAGVEVYLDGSLIGKTDNKKGEIFIPMLLKGKHSLKLVHGNCIDALREVDIKPDKTLVIKEIMEKKWMPTHTIILHSDKILKGIVVRETEKKVTLKIKYGEVVIDKSSIKKIKKIEE